MILSQSLWDGRWVLRELYCVACGRSVGNGSSFVEWWFEVGGVHMRESELWRIHHPETSVIMRHTAIRSGHSCTCDLRIFISVKTASDYDVARRKISGDGVSD